MSMIIHLLYCGIASFFFTFFHLCAFTISSNDECRNCTIILHQYLDGGLDSKVICFSKKANKAGSKLSRRFQLKEKEELIDECAEESTSVLAVENYWLILRGKQNDNGNVDVQTSLLKNNLTDFSMNPKFIEEIVQEVRLGVFLVDLIEKFPSVLCFIFSELLMEKQSKGSSSTNETTNTKLDITTTTIITTTAPSLVRPRPIKMPKTMTNGTTIAFHAKVDYDAEFFSIRLLHNAPEFHHLVGNTLLEIKVNFTEENIHWQAYSKQKPYGANSVPNHFPFMVGQEFECVMTIMQNDTEIENVPKVEKRIQIEVKVNGHKLFHDFVGNLPIWALNWMQIEGDIQLFETSPPQPVITFANDTTGLFKLEMKHLLYFGDFLCIGGNLTNEFIRLYLLLGATEYIDREIVENTAMRLEHSNYSGNNEVGPLRLDPASQFEMNGFILYRNEWKWRFIGKYNFKPIMGPGHPIIIKIEVIEKEIPGNRQRLFNPPMYFITLVGMKGQVNVTTVNIPRWAVNWITVEHLDNPVLNPSNVEECKGAGQKELPGNICQLDSDHLFVSGDLIEFTVAGKVENVELVEVFLFREALEWHKFIGQTVLRVRFMSGNFSFNSYSSKNYNPESNPNEKWHYEADNATNSGILPEPLVANRTFELKIVAVTKNAFDISYEGVELHYINSTLPIWAAQYVVVNGLKIPADGEPNLVSVEYKPQNKEAT